MRRVRPRELGFGLVLGVAGALLSWWFATHTRPMNDEGAVLTAAAKLLRGGVFYRDVDAYWLPGSAYLLAAAMGLFGEHLAVARVLAGLVYVTTLLTLYALALRLVDFRRAACFGLALLALKVLAWPAWTAYFYWDLAFCAACLALLSLLVREGSRPRLTWAGFFIGLAFLFKQNVGLYLGAASVALLLLPGALLGPATVLGIRVRNVLRLGLGIAVATAPPLIYFAVHGLLGELLHATFVRPLVGYLATSGVSFGAPLAWWKLGSFDGEMAFYFPMPYFLLLRSGALPGEAMQPAYWLAGELFTRLLYTSVLLAAVGALFLAVRRGRPRDHRERRFLAGATLTAAVVASAFPRADLTHVFAVYPLVLLVLVQLWERFADRRGWGIPTLELGVVTLAVVLVAGVAGLHQARRTHRVELPRARVWVPPEHAYLATVVEHVAKTLAPDDRFFVYGNEAHLYFLSGRFFPWRFTQLYPGQTGGDRGAALAALLREEPPALMVRGWTGRLAELPAIPSYAPLLEEEVQSSFLEDRSFFDRNAPAAGAAPSSQELSLWRFRRR